HTRFSRDWSSDVCSPDLTDQVEGLRGAAVSALEPGPEPRVASHFRGPPLTMCCVDVPGMAGPPRPWDPGRALPPVISRRRLNPHLRGRGKLFSVESKADRDVSGQRVRVTHRPRIYQPDGPQPVALQFDVVLPVVKQRGELGCDLQSLSEPSTALGPHVQGVHHATPKPAV